MAGINELVYLIIYVILAGVLIYVVHYILNMLTLPQPVKHAILIIIALLVILWFLRMFGVL